METATLNINRFAISTVYNPSHGYIGAGFGAPFVESKLLLIDLWTGVIREVSYANCNEFSEPSSVPDHYIQLVNPVLIENNP